MPEVPIVSHISGSGYSLTTFHGTAMMSGGQDVPLSPSADSWNLVTEYRLDPPTRSTPPSGSFLSSSADHRLRWEQRQRARQISCPTWPVSISCRVSIKHLKLRIGEKERTVRSLPRPFPTLSQSAQNFFLALSHLLTDHLNPTTPTRTPAPVIVSPPKFSPSKLTSPIIPAQFAHNTPKPVAALPRVENTTCWAARWSRVTGNFANMSLRSERGWRRAVEGSGYVGDDIICW